MIRQLAAFGAGVTVILVGAWFMAVRAAIANYDPNIQYD